MPLYEYRCSSCGHEFETEQRITADPLKDCPQCTKPALERLISRTSFALKGGGWYKDAYSSSGSSSGSSGGVSLAKNSTSSSAKENGDKVADAIKKSE